MICPKCKCEAVISTQKMVFDKANTKLYRALTYSCRNKKCEKFDKEIGEVKNEVPISVI